MDIASAKQQIKNTVQIYLQKDALGRYRLPLVHQRKSVAAQSVLLQVDLHGIFDLLFCTCYIHDSVSSSVRVFCGSSRRMLSVVSTARMAQLGTWGLMWSSRLKMKAVL